MYIACLTFAAVCSTCNMAYAVLFSCLLYFVAADCGSGRPDLSKGKMTVKTVVHLCLQFILSDKIFVGTIL